MTKISSAFINCPACGADTFEMICVGPAPKLQISSASLYEDMQRVALLECSTCGHTIEDDVMGFLEHLILDEERGE